MKKRLVKYFVFGIFVIGIAGIAYAGSEDEFFKFFFGVPNVAINHEMIISMVNGREFQVSASTEEIEKNISFDRTFQLQMADGTYIINGKNIAYIRVLQ